MKSIAQLPGLRVTVGWPELVVVEPLHLPGMDGQPDGKYCAVRRTVIAVADIASLMLQDISRQPEPQAGSGGSLGGKKG